MFFLIKPKILLENTVVWLGVVEFGWFSSFLPLLLLCFSFSIHNVCLVSSNGVTLLSLLRQWDSVRPSFNSSLKASDSTTGS